MLFVYWGTDHPDLYWVQWLGRIRSGVRQLRRKGMLGVRRAGIEAHKLLHLRREADGNVDMLALPWLRAVT